LAKADGQKMFPATRNALLKVMNDRSNGDQFANVGETSTRLLRITKALLERALHSADLMHRSVSEPQAGRHGCAS
jgi:hypothetical protein